ncbi:MAG TPA: phosphomannomutase/phosphoglucomutase [Thermodesulfobacteriota bacterium]|jgi:phosphomannomutase/phosphoglucomutase|nr:phosphomannomutase/phosphoglucomutase [Thermodesulfobacteriota bacterium]
MKKVKVEVKTMQINPQIFREYDIRGVVNKDLTPAIVRRLGQGFGTHMAQLDRRDLVVGRDGRLSSEVFEEALIEGLLSAGCNVVNIGLCPTPIYYFSIFHLDKDGGMMVTGSHNPPEFNGFKVSVGKTTIFGEEIQNLRRLIEKREFLAGKGKLSEEETVQPYREYVKKNVHTKKKLKVVIDAGNGTAGVVAGPLLRDLGCELEELYCEVDGRFPNHFPDPTIPKNLEVLIDRVKKTRADVGIGYDGDADRIGVVDDQGNIIWGDQLMILFSREILKDKKEATFVAEVKCSQNLFNDIEKHGGKAIMYRTGHSLIEEKIREEKAALGGEMSGHIFFADRYFGYDDAIYASCRLIELLSKTDKKLSQLLSDVPKTFITPEIRVDCADEIKFKVVETVKEALRRDYPVIDVDGVRVKFEDGWGLVRASNTQPALVLRFEALTQNRLNEIKEFVEKKVQEAVFALKGR